MKKSMILGCLTSILMAMPAFAQWSGNTANPLQISESYIWGNDMVADDEGNVYFYYLSPMGNIDTLSSMRIIPYVKRINYDGTEAWDRPLQLSAYPTRTSTTINNYLALDKENNLVAVVWDARLDSVNRRYTATAYKITPDGQHLWGDAGVNLCEGKTLLVAACMNLMTLDDNSTVFVWEGVENADQAAHHVVYMQRLSADGKPLWTGKRIADEQTSISYPHMVYAGYNEYYLFYCLGSNPDFYVQKFDFDGNAVWAQPTLVYGGGGLGNDGVMQTILNVAPAKNGLLVGWSSDANGSGQDRNYIAYIDRDGKHVFSAGADGLQVGYSELRSFQPSLVYNYESDDIYVTWRETNPVQSHSQIRAQRISASGELMWDPAGIEICKLEERQVGYESVQAGLKGGVIFFFMAQKSKTDFKHTTAYATLYSREGRPIWENQVVAVSDNESAKGRLESLPLRKNQWIIAFRDNRHYGNASDYGLFANNILIDGTLGSDAHLLANEDGLVEVEDVSFGVYPNPVRESLNVNIETGHPATLRLTLCNLLGMEVASLYNGCVQGFEVLHIARPAGLKDGIYVLKAIWDGKEQSVKVVWQ